MLPHAVRTWGAAAAAFVLAAPAARSQIPGSRPKLMVVSAADVGMSSSINRAAFAAVDRGTVSSVSVMVVGDAFDEAVALIRKHPGLDVGMHLVVSAEWPNARWRPILPSAVVPSLCEADGSLHRRFDPAAADAREVEQELRAQLMVARAAGIPMTHLDVHKNAIYGSGGRYADLLARVARDEDLPIVLARAGATAWGALAAQLPESPVLDAWTTITPKETPARWFRWYELAIRGAPAGVSQIVVHPGYDEPGLRVLTEGAEAWGAAWRQRDLDVLLGDDLKRELEERKVQLVGWRDIPRRARQSDARQSDARPRR
jgi:hypothetical protein